MKASDIKRMETENQNLKLAIKDIHEMFEEGIIIRDISKDADEDHYRRVSIRINMWVAKTLVLLGKPEN